MLDKFCLNLNKIIIGNVGRLSLQKNHKLMIKIANIMKEKKYNMCFICVGCGELENEIKKEVFDNGLNDYFILVGETDSVNKFYSMFDVFCFPSLFEGLGIAFLEAQVSGLPCVISNKVPDEAVISSRVSKLNINDSPERWLDEICCLAKNSKSIDRINLCNFLLPSANQYEVGNNIEMLKQIYGME